MDGISSFEGRGAVITGGASGIGLATATEFARRGARLVLADVDGPGLEQAVTHLRGQGFDAHGVLCDVRHLEEVVHLADEAFRLLGQVDVVFSNAGIVVAGPIAEMTHEDWRWVIDIDLWGSIHSVEAFLPRLLDQGSGGHLVFTASFAGLVPNAGLGAYGVAKYGVVALAETLAREVKNNGIGVSVLCPMVIETKLVSNSERIRGADYGLASSPEVTGSFGPLPAQDDTVNVAEFARLTADAILANRLYVLPHEASRASIRRRFERIDRTFDEQVAEGWRH
ncbi:short-chain dehydrogenase [Mycobacterium kiyosense]|uniref:Short-chain dehydrogenase n=1 Tax=Mycobacterium kiyosense TaxID=2871094 RepID=A0AA37Q7V1_9MYCO|nr:MULTISPECIES: SDR family NAD(P)-dependent oxidoreductase [Mycobacterium]BDB45015.1 short-chain dehydrogenase [Mycobacterium kiyosense]BDE16496.1 short-chain dehydrogenase [Mycobacterium sp. 20KCMC460]GLB85329.1 short-chain dehydrogenase [Mycobacterium kiyosense]GLB89711.1 short-chain dehydrogenase [Mycobacterium kiyosense]GLB98110.1 short-chain dehydrogenase [Mycobacterium kiyosense]